LAVWPVSPPAASSWASRPATRATERLTDRSAFGRTTQPARTIRADRPGGLLRFRV
jgi:hypothetical protein